LRAELAEGHGEAAGRLLRLRRECGNRDAATACFAGALEAIDTHGAQGRLDFELRVATEIPPDILLHLATSSVTMKAGAESTRRMTPDTPPPPALEGSGVERIIGPSSFLDTVRETIYRVADTGAPVLITGETGTGKELVATALHEVGGHSGEPFVAVNCGAISESLLESELFGHEKGAFTGAAEAHQGLFEEAGNGTILLDEIGDITPRLQKALLRVLETAEIRPVGSGKPRPIRCRILASTNADLEEMCADQRFRADLFYRLRRLEIRMSPLRERREDILPLAVHFLNQGRPEGVHAVMSAALAEALQAQSWPGNVRELRNTVERARLMNSDKLYYDPGDFDLPPRPGTVQEAAASLHSTVTAPTAAREQPVRIKAEHRKRSGNLKAGRSRVRRLAVLRELFNEHKVLTRSEVAKTLEISPNTATRDLEELCRKDFVERVSPSASPRSVYFRLKERS